MKYDTVNGTITNLGVDMSPSSEMTFKLRKVKSISYLIYEKSPTMGEEDA